MNPLHTDDELELNWPKKKHTHNNKFGWWWKDLLLPRIWCWTLFKREREWSRERNAAQTKTMCFLNWEIYTHSHTQIKKNGEKKTLSRQTDWLYRRGLYRLSLGVYGNIRGSVPVVSFSSIDRQLDSAFFQLSNCDLEFCRFLFFFETLNQSVCGLTVCHTHIR